MFDRKRYALGIGLCLVGCNAPMMPGTPQFIDQQDTAVQIIWQEAYGRSDGPPEIRWVSEDEQNCVDPTSGNGGFRTLVGCVEGFTLSYKTVSVSWHDGDSFSVTALAHELVHAAQARRLVFDYNHHTAEFQPGGAVDQANARLSDAGL
jgi:hypothetical protein